MGAPGALFKTGLVLLGIGFLVALVVPPLGLLLGRLGLVLIGGALLLPVLSIGLLSVVAIAVGTGADSDDPPQTGLGARRRDPTARDRRPASGTEPSGPTTTGTEQPDLDVASIDDYRR